MDRFKLLALATVIVVAAGAAITWAGMSVVDRAGGMATTGTSASAFAAAKTGTPIKLVVSVDRLTADGGFAAEILDKGVNDTYSHSGTHVAFHVPANAKFLMGGRNDLKPGAVLQVNGQIADARRLAVSEIVVLNGFVRIAP